MAETRFEPEIFSLDTFNQTTQPCIHVIWEKCNYTIPHKNSSRSWVYECARYWMAWTLLLISHDLLLRLAWFFDIFKARCVSYIQDSLNTIRAQVNDTNTYLHLIGVVIKEMFWEKNDLPKHVVTFEPLPKMNWEIHGVMANLLNLNLTGSSEYYSRVSCFMFMGL